MSYVKAEASVIPFEAEDIITTSGCSGVKGNQGNNCLAVTNNQGNHQNGGNKKP